MNFSNAICQRELAQLVEAWVIASGQIASRSYCVMPVGLGDISVRCLDAPNGIVLAFDFNKLNKVDAMFLRLVLGRIEHGEMEDFEPELYPDPWAC